MAEFIAWVKSQPNKLSYAEGSAGSVTHLSMALFLKRAGLEMTNVSYRGNAPALTDVIAGHLPTMFSNLSDALPHRADRRDPHSRGIERASVSRSSRTCRPSPSSAFPATRSSPGTACWRRPATPKPIVDKIAAEIARACKDPKFRRAASTLRRRSVRHHAGSSSPN